MVPLPPEDANYAPEAAGTRAGAQAARDPPAGGAELRGRRPRAPLAEAGGCGSASRPARAWCCTPSATRTRGASARSSTAPRSPRWWCPTATRGPTYFHRNAFDVGEYGIGMLRQLARARLRLPRARSATSTRWSTTGRASPVTLENAICLHEEDSGILWKHFDWRLGTTEVRRSRRLVISSISTVGNYEYGFYWYFYQDGTIQLEVKLTGIISNGAEPPGEKPRWGELVAPGVYAPDPPALLQRPARLDRGRRPTTRSTRSTPSPTPPGPDNPHGQRLPRRGDAAGPEAAGAAAPRPARRALLEDREPVGARTASASRSATS